MSKRSEALTRARYRINALYVESKLKSYSAYGALANAARFLSELEALTWAIDVALAGEGVGEGPPRAVPVPVCHEHERVG